jgi:hypothetical protein
MIKKKRRRTGGPAPRELGTNNEHGPLTQITIETQDGGLRRIRYYVAFTIEHEISRPLADGSPWPPNGDGWTQMRGLSRGHSLWRRIRPIDSRRDES